MILMILPQAVYVLPRRFDRVLADRWRDFVYRSPR